MKKIFSQLYALIKKYWHYEIIRFLFVGGINTAFGGFALPFIIRLVIPQFDHWTLLGVQINIPITIGYLLWFTPAYLLQVFISFQSHPEWKRYAIYPFTQIPNYALQQSFFYTISIILGWMDIIAYGLSAILPIPIMFFLVRLIVKTKKKQ